MVVFWDLNKPFLNKKVIINQEWEKEEKMSYLVHTCRMFRFSIVRMAGDLSTNASSMQTTFIVLFLS